MQAIARRLREIPTPSRGGPPRGARFRQYPLYIELTGGSSLAPNRWLYSYKMVAPVVGGRADHYGGATQAEMGFALNTAEFNNTATSAAGYDLTAEPFATQGAVIVPAWTGSPVVPATRADCLDGNGAVVRAVWFTLQLVMRLDCEGA